MLLRIVPKHFVSVARKFEHAVRFVAKIKPQCVLHMNSYRTLQNAGEERPPFGHDGNGVLPHLIKPLLDRRDNVLCVIQKSDRAHLLFKGILINFVNFLRDEGKKRLTGVATPITNVSAMFKRPQSVTNPTGDIGRGTSTVQASSSALDGW